MNIKKNKPTSEEIKRAEERSKQLLESFREQQEEKQRKNDNINDKILAPIMEMVECSYLVNTSIKTWKRSNFGLPQWNYYLAQVPHLHLTIALDYIASEGFYDQREIVSFEMKYGNLELIHQEDLSSLDLEKVAEIIKLLAMKITIEMNLKEDPQYFEKFFNIK
jgi:hypothetical protein